MKKTIAVVGLGLIGGSLALALKGFEDFEIVGVDVSQPTLRYAAEHGESSVVLRSGEVHRFLRMRNSMPSVCNAMYTSMNDGDEVLDSSPSGYSSTLTIRFNVQHE